MCLHEEPISFLRTLTVCTELEIPKVLPVDVLEHCILSKYEACPMLHFTID